MSIGWVTPGGGGGGGVSEVTSTDGTITIANPMGPTVDLSAGPVDTISFEFSRGGNTASGAPIGPDSGANGAPGFVAPFDLEINSWTMAFASANTNLTGGVTVNVVDTSVSPWVVASSTALTAIAVKDTGSSDQVARGSASISVPQGFTISIASAVNEAGAGRTVSQVVVKLRAKRTP